MTFCWEICESYDSFGCSFKTETIYGKDFMVDLKIVADNEEKIISLREDALVPTLLGLEIHLSQLYLRIRKHL